MTDTATTAAGQGIRVERGAKRLRAGQAAYWSVVIDGEAREDAAWAYATPLPESEGVAGLLCFYPSRVDVIVDGVRQA